ncbi:MAG: ATP-binding cassette domain-containing protein [Oscillospiraceae bacterium]|nr:ATP-binding cassette domain-containing protein [Oscillospiraceae bacterium]
MQQVMNVNELTVRYGDGCVYCIDSDKSLDKNRCPKCKTVWAVRNVSFSLYHSEVLGVVGESGSGKSTLMKTLYFDREATSGQTFLNAYEDGKTNIFSVSSQQQRAIRNNLLGMVYQNPLLGLLMDFSNGGNIAQKLIAAGHRNVSAMQSRTFELLEHMEISVNRVKEPPKNFSGGMQQRVQISKAIANNPPVLLLDEVTTGLDLSVQAKVLDLIRMVQKKFNISIIVVSHDLAVIRMLSDRTIVMLDGQIVEHGFTDQILEDPQHPFTQTLVHSLI